MASKLSLHITSSILGLDELSGHLILRLFFLLNSFLLTTSLRLGLGLHVFISAFILLFNFVQYHCCARDSRDTSC
jgi:hypothetical protein